MSELKITQEKVTAAFSEANDCPKAISILTALFGKQKPDYTDYHNIKTYEDACEAIGVKPIVRLLVEDEDGHKIELIAKNRTEMKKILIICVLFALIAGCASPRNSVENHPAKNSPQPDALPDNKKNRFTKQFQQADSMFNEKYRLNE